MKNLCKFLLLCSVAYIALHHRHSKIQSLSIQFRQRPKSNAMSMNYSCLFYTSMWYIMCSAKSCRSCVVSNLHRVPVKPSPRPCNCHNHLVFAMCSLQEALPSHCGSAERCIRRTIISPKSEYCFAL